MYHRFTGDLLFSAYDFVMDELSDCPTTQTPPPWRASFSLDFVKERNRGVLFGGYNARDCNDVHLFNVPATTWIQPVVKGKPPKELDMDLVLTTVGYTTIVALIMMPGFPGGMFFLELSSDGVAMWSQPRQIFSGIRPKRLNSFGMIFCQGALLLLVGHIGVKPFLYDLKTRRFAREQLGGPFGI